MKPSGYWLAVFMVGILVGLAALGNSRAQNTPQDLSTHPGWMLAAACFACHGTDGTDSTFGKLAGDEAAEMIEEMEDLKKTNSADAAIMKVHALGYSDAQIKLIADYFSKVSK